MKFNLIEDPVSCLMDVGEHYVVTTETQEAGGLSSRDLVVYSSRTGMRLFEKDIFSSHDISCLALYGPLLYLGAGNTVEVWDVNISSCLAIIQSGSPDFNNIRVNNVAASDFLMVASLSNGNIFYIPVMEIIRQSLLASSEPAIINWQVAATLLSNTELTWKNIDFSRDNIVFGLEKKLGDIKIMTWNRTGEKPRLKYTEEDIDLK